MGVLKKLGVVDVRFFYRKNALSDTYSTMSTKMTLKYMDYGTNANTEIKNFLLWTAQLLITSNNCVELLVAKTESQEH